MVHEPKEHGPGVGTLYKRVERTGAGVLVSPEVWRLRGSMEFESHRRDAYGRGPKLHGMMPSVGNHRLGLGATINYLYDESMSSLIIQIVQAHGRKRFMMCGDE